MEGRREHAYGKSHKLSW